MSVKAFKFSVVDMRSGVTGEFIAHADKIDQAFKAGAKTLPAVFADKQPGLRLFRFRFSNAVTGEFSAALGQGDEVLAAWSDVLKGARDHFRPKNDGRYRPPNGFCVLLAPRAGDVPDARGRAVSRTIEAFESDETYAAEQRRLRLEEERKRLQEAGRVA